MLHTDVSSLQRIPMFKGVDPAKLKLIALASERASYKPGEHLLNEGDRADAVYVVIEGEAKILRHGTSQEIELARVTSGSVVGDMGVVLDRPYSGTIVAATPVVALRIDKRTFLELLAQIPQFSLAVIRELAGRLLATSDSYVKAVSR
jgi:CRP-like cAMP-binding protein